MLPSTQTLELTATHPPIPTTTPPLLPTSTPTRKSVSAADVDAYRMKERMARGVNLGNALEAPYEGSWGVIIQDDFFPLIKNAGFNTIRVPIRWNAHAAEKSPYTIDPAFFERVDRVVKLALENGLIVILDFHHYLELMETPSVHKERFLAIWQQIAEHYQDYSDDVIFEILNEPNGAFGTKDWNEYAQAAITTIRASNPQRILIVGPGNWNAIPMLHELQLPALERRIIVTVHYYLPFKFTHQGADWAEGSDAWMGTKWSGSQAEKDTIRRDFTIAARWSEENSRPIFLGEFGAYSKADIDSRALWTAYVSRTAEELGFAWAYWEFCAGFGVYDSSMRAWNEPILKALIP
jgi:endoglucanase